MTGPALRVRVCLLSLCLSLSLSGSHSLSLLIVLGQKGAVPPPHHHRPERRTAGSNVFPGHPLLQRNGPVDLSASPVVPIATFLIYPRIQAERASWPSSSPEERIRQTILVSHAGKRMVGWHPRVSLSGPWERMAARLRPRARVASGTRKWDHERWDESRVCVCVCV